MAITLTLNGRPASFDVDPETPLLWVIRETAGLTGSKFGCGAGLCGACTVHLAGRPIRSCITKIGDMQGATVTTIEGVSGRVAAAVQAKWIALDVVQCGYCQSGQVMAAIALLEQTRKPTDSDIDEAMSGNICRCGTYQRIRAAIHETARTMES